MPFLIIGLGVDNTFVITGAYFDRPDPTLPPAERIAMTLKRAGPSVLVSVAVGIPCLGRGRQHCLVTSSSYSVTDLVFPYLTYCRIWRAAGTSDFPLCQ